MAKKPKLDEAAERRFIDAFQDGVPMELLVERFDVDESVLRRILQKRGVARRPGRNKRYDEA